MTRNEMLILAYARCREANAETYTVERAALGYSPSEIQDTLAVRDKSNDDLLLFLQLPTPGHMTAKDRETLTTARAFTGSRWRITLPGPYVIQLRVLRWNENCHRYEEQATLTSGHVREHAADRLFTNLKAALLNWWRNLPISNGDNDGQ